MRVSILMPDKAGGGEASPNLTTTVLSATADRLDTTWTRYTMANPFQLHDPDRPRSIDMELTRDNAKRLGKVNPDEWEAFVSWYCQEGCELAIQFFHSLW